MRRGGEDGFILVSVLGALIVLAGLVGAVSYLVRTAVTGAAQSREALTMDALTRSGVELAGYELFSLRRPASAVNGQQIRLNDGVVTLFVAGEGGKIDLNGAPPELLAGAWASIGAPAGLAPEAFAARVVDYRDPDNEKSAQGGAEAADYAAAAPNRLPANAPFERVDDLQYVLGVTPAAVRALAPILTVHNPAGKLSIMDVSTAALRATPGGGAAADKIRALRLQTSDDMQGALDAALGDAAKYFSPAPSAAYAVRVEVRRGADGFRATKLILTGSKTTDALFFTTDRDDHPPS